MVRFSERTFVGLALFISVSVVAACGGSFERNDAVDTYLLVNPDATSETANCVIDTLLATYSEERVQAEMDAQRTSNARGETAASENDDDRPNDDAIGPDEDLPGSEVAIVDLRDGFVSADFEETQFRAAFGCSDVAQQLQAELEATGLSAADATCVATSLTNDLDDRSIDTLLSGASDEALDEKFTNVMAECGLPTSESGDS